MAAPTPPSAFVDIRLRVPAMDCADEVALVRRALDADPGVVHAAFDLVDSRVDLTIDPAQTTEARVRDAIARTGLAVDAAPAATPAPRRAGASSPELWISGALVIIGWVIDGVSAETWSEAVFGHAGDGGFGHAHAGWSIPIYGVATIAGLWRTWPRALAALRHLRLDMHVLVCLSAVGAAAVGQWAEAAAVAFLFALAHRLEGWSLERAREALATVADRGVLSAGGQPSAPVERWIERFAAIYTPAVTLAAVIVAAGPPLVDGAWGQWFYRALVFLVLACPCALVISTPVAVVAAVTALARHGVVVKGGGPLELAAATRHASREALARAGVQVASRAEGPAAMAAADVVLVDDPPRGNELRLFVQQSRYALTVIRQNVGLALVTKLAFLMSALLGTAPLWMAVLADTGASVAVTLNALRLLRPRVPD
jgi:cation transport ATPase